MCVVSMTGDFFRDRWTTPERYGTIEKIIEYGSSGVTKSEFDALKEEVKLMKELLKKSKEYDEKNNEPNCEIDEKIDLLRKIAAIVGINLDDIFVKKV